jgi:tRNA A37 methylthiotransferase MiaB
VLVEGPSKRNPDELFTRTDAFRPVIIPAAPGIAAGALLDVVIERTTAATMFGRVV